MDHHFYVEYESFVEQKIILGQFLIKFLDSVWTEQSIIKYVVLYILEKSLSNKFWKNSVTLFILNSLFMLFKITYSVMGMQALANKHSLSFTQSRIVHVQCNVMHGKWNLQEQACVSGACVNMQKEYSCICHI